MATFDSSTVGSDVAPSYSPKLSIENDVIRVDMGDGFEQRLKRGINSTRRTYTLSFTARTDTVTTNILNFLASSTGGDNGAKAFTWTPPYGSTGKWVCENPSVTITSYNLNDIELVFREVFEP
tara:strand:+ start:1157 stop:1525 length:369 start_codon:yes stop_codon:yes gene_type:complete